MLLSFLTSSPHGSGLTSPSRLPLGSLPPSSHRSKKKKRLAADRALPFCVPRTSLYFLSPPLVHKDSFHTARAHTSSSGFIHLHIRHLFSMTYLSFKSFTSGFDQFSTALIFLSCIHIFTLPLNFHVLSLFLPYIQDTCQIRFVIFAISVLVNDLYVDYKFAISWVIG